MSLCLFNKNNGRRWRFTIYPSSRLIELEDSVRSTFKVAAEPCRRWSVDKQGLLLVETKLFQLSGFVAGFYFFRTQRWYRIQDTKNPYLDRWYWIYLHEISMPSVVILWQMLTDTSTTCTWKCSALPKEIHSEAARNTPISNKTQGPMDSLWTLSVHAVVFLVLLGWVQGEEFYTDQIDMGAIKAFQIPLGTAAVNQIDNSSSRRLASRYS